jgi:hypothetical protein
MAAGAVVESVSQVSELAAGKLDSEMIVYCASGRDDAQLKLLLDRLLEPLDRGQGAGDPLTGGGEGVGHEVQEVRPAEQRPPTRSGAR